MKRLMNTLFIAASMLLSALVYAKAGLLFNIAESGATASADVILCLNGKGPLSCQNYHVSAQDLQIRTTAKHAYPIAGIKVLTPEYKATGCTIYPETGYCLFATSNTTAAIVHLSSGAQKKVPGAPTNVTATAGNASATVNWTAPSNGGSPITGYTVTPSPSGGSCTASGTTASCTGLTNGTSYTFAVYATNAIGNGSATNSNAVTPTAPATVPGAPTNVTATVGNTSATVNWTAPSNGGSPITGYTVTPSPSGGSCTASGTTASCTGLTNGTSYTFAVYATNAIGNGPSTNSNSITPELLTPPSAPTDVTATPGSNGQVTVSWSPSSNTGGSLSSSILYTVTYGATGSFPYNTSISTCSSISATSCVVNSGPNIGTAYTFKVTAAVSGVNSGNPAPYLAGYSNSATPTDSLATSVNTLVLSVKATDTNVALTGVPRIITLTNASSGAIDGLTVGFPSGTWNASGTTGITDCTTSSLSSPGDTCTITVTPGANATSGCTNGTTAPTPDSITIAYTGSAPINIPVYVLGYNCTYQGGSVFAIDDTTPTTSSIAGTVFATADQNPTSGSVAWSSAFDPIWGIDDSSTTSNPSPDSSSSPSSTYINGQLNCDGMSDGLCNSNNIVAFASTSPSNYPASTASTMCSQALTGTGSLVCTAGTADCYNDWYLPALCELDSGNNGFSACPSGMQSVLSSIPSFSNLSVAYWASTEYSSSPQINAWQEYFISSGVGDQYSLDKELPSSNGVRCARGLTN